FRMRVVLEIVSGPSAGKAFEVADGQTTRVGFRGPSDFLVPDDPWLSDVHFAVECRGGMCRLRNLNRRGWTTLNGEQVTEGIVRDGDRIVAGGTRFVVRVAPDAAAPAAAAPAQVPEQPAAPMGMAPPPATPPNRVLRALRG